MGQSKDDNSAESGREQRLLAVLDAYFQAVESGAAIDRRAWLEQHPDLTDDLARFLDEQDRLMRLTEPLHRPTVQAALTTALERTLAELSGEGNADGPPGAQPTAPLKNGAANGMPGPKSRDFGDYELIEQIAGAAWASSSRPGSAA